MRCILDHGDAFGITQGHNPIHVRRVPAHMRDDDSLNVLFDLFGEVIEINAVITSNFAQNWLAIGMHDGGGHSSEREAGDQNSRAFRQAKRLERQEKRGRTGRHGQRVFAAHHLGEFGFQQRNGRVFGRGVTEQVTGLHQFLNVCHHPLWNGFGGMYVWQVRHFAFLNSNFRTS